jgi:hypothetical protein
MEKTRKIFLGARAPRPPETACRPFSRFYFDTRICASRSSRKKRPLRGRFFSLAPLAATTRKPKLCYLSPFPPAATGGPRPPPPPEPPPPKQKHSETHTDKAFTFSGIDEAAADFTFTTSTKLSRLRRNGRINPDDPDAPERQRRARERTEHRRMPSGAARDAECVK